MSFEYTFWDDKDYLYIASKKKGYFPIWKHMRNELFEKFQDREEAQGPEPGDDDRMKGNFLLCYCSGDEAKRIERLAIEDLKDEIEALLESIYSPLIKIDEEYRIYRPNKIHVCKWDTDPRFCGSYTYCETKAFESTDGESTDLNKPLGFGNKLYFAGEAHGEYNGFVQGAYTSGESTAQEIIESMKK